MSRYAIGFPSLAMCVYMCVCVYICVCMCVSTEVAHLRDFHKGLIRDNFVELT